MNFIACMAVVTSLSTSSLNNNSKMIPINELVRAHHADLDELRRAWERVVASGRFMLGDEVAGFERSFAEYCGAAHCVGVANGTDALEIALRAIQIQPGEKVAAVANAGMYSTIAITACEAEPIFVDINPATLCMSHESLLSVLDQSPRAVIVTHLFGRLAAVEELSSATRAAGAMLIEDCAQAHGARRGGKRAGTFGDVGCFSFYPTKNLGALGDAGAIISNEKSLADSARQMRQYGWGRKYHCEVVGGKNSRLDELQAAFLSVKLRWLDEQNYKRRQIAKCYWHGINNVHITTQSRDDESDVVHLYVVRTQHQAKLAEHLSAAGIQTDIHYPVPDHCQRIFQNRFSKVHLPVTEKLATEILTLPCHPNLSREEIAHVINACNNFAP